MYNKIKDWIKENGIVGLGALIVTIFALFTGAWFLFWGSLGFLAGKNWEIILKLWNESKLKDKFEDVKDRVEDKFEDVKDKVIGGGDEDAIEK